MRLEPMKEQKKPYFDFICLKCKKPFSTKAEEARGREVFADLDGLAFVAYYCEECKQEMEVIK